MAARTWDDWVPPSPPPPPELVPAFGPQVGWSPDRDCRSIHPNGPIPPGSKLVCMACHTSGLERVVSRHTKPGDGLTREGWSGPTPTRIVDADEPGGRGDAPRPGGKPGLKGGRA